MTNPLAWLKAHLLKITAGVLLLIAVILALFDRVAAGTLVAALFVVVALFDSCHRWKASRRSASKLSGVKS